MTVALHRCAGDELDAKTLHDVLKLRIEVFVVEQACPYPEIDGLDLLETTRHYWLESPDGEVISTLRVMGEDPEVSRIGRVCTSAPERGRGHTTRLLEAALTDLGGATSRLNAQSHLADMYGRHGFVVDGPEFLEDGIPHVPMVRAGRQ